LAFPRPARRPARQRGMQTAAAATGGRWLRPGTRLLVHRRRAPPQTVAASEAQAGADDGRSARRLPPGPSGAVAACAVGCDHVAARAFNPGNTGELYGSLKITGRKQGRGDGDPFLQPKIAGHERAERGTPRSEIPMSSLSIPNRNRIAGARMRATKTGNSSRRAGSRSFGEYIFLEDSRYASQHKNMRRKRIYPPFA